MRKIVVRLLVCATIVLGLAVSSFAVDGVVLINQATVNAAGGFPYKITQPGSYKLSGNLVVPANTDGIDMNADNVTLDLNGFTITGPVTCTGLGGDISCSADIGGYGIFAEGRRNVTVRNGSVVGFDHGVVIRDAFTTLGVGQLVEEVHVSGNHTSGILVSNGVVRRNTASGNGGDGIDADFSVVTENIANFNGGNGLNLRFGAFGNNTFFGNGGVAFFPNNSAVSLGNACGGSFC